MRKWIQGFFDGSNSSMRLTLILSVVVIWGVWAFITLWKMELQDIPTGVVAMAIGLFACKVGQSAFEKAAATTSTTETTTLKTAEGASAIQTKTSESVPVPAPETEK